MQLHQLKPNHKFKKVKRVGRGGKKGTYSGRGQKGQKSRAGRKMRPIIRDWIKRYPKLRGYKFKRQKEKLVIINLEMLEKKFSDITTVTPQTLVEKKIIRRIKGKMPKVKILGKGEVTKPFTVEDCLLSKQAKEKIEKAGGKLKIPSTKHQIPNKSQVPNSKSQTV